MNMLAGLAAAFAQVGICAFGGGLSTLPLIEYQLVTSTGWLTREQFNQVLAMSQVTPGPIAINAATFVGFQQAGFWGSLVATLSLVAAPIALLSIVIQLLKFASDENSRRIKAFLRPVVAGLLFLSLLSPLKATIGNGSVALALFVFGLLLLKFCRIFRENPPILLLLYGAIGAVLLSGTLFPI